MNLSSRSKMSLVQFIRKMPSQDAALLLMKYAMVAPTDQMQVALEIEASLTEMVLHAGAASLSDLVQELARTEVAREIRTT